MKQLLNGELVDMTPEEVSAREAEIAQAEADAAAQAEAKAQADAQATADKEAKDALKASAKAKLVAGTPLTEEEANTIVL